MYNKSICSFDVIFFSTFISMETMLIAKTGAFLDPDSLLPSLAGAGMAKFKIYSVGLNCF